MDYNILPMTIKHFEKIEPILLDKFDSFWSSSTLKNELQNPNSQYFVALLNDDIIGFGGIWKAVDDCHITDIVVRKDFRNHGIGSKILEKLIQVAKQTSLSSLTLEVNANNVPAQKLYKKYGFISLGVRKKYYNNVDDAIIMTLYF